MNKKGFVGAFIVLLVVLFVMACIIVPIVLSYKSVTEVTITIVDKERITDGRDSYYLVFTENEVFKNSDSTLHWKFDSSDVYNKLKVGETYTVKVNWYRVPFWSMYRNI